MKHTEIYKINTHDADCNGYLSPTGFMRYMQDAAFSQLECERPSYDELFENGLAFVVSRFKAEFIKPVYSHDVVETASWALKESSGFSFRRSYEMKKNGETAAVAKSVWAMFNMNTQRLARVTEVGGNYGTAPDVEMDFPRKIPSASDIIKVGEHRVAYGDIDRNRHMNNTRYADMLCGYVPGIVNKRVTSFDIYYSAEAHFEDTVEIFRGEINGAYYFKTVRGDGKVNVEALIKAENL